MNSGIISSRYATALLKYVQYTGRGQQVCDQVVEIIKDPDYLSRGPLEPELERFVPLLIRNGRLADVRMIFLTFIQKYYDSIGVKTALLTTVEPVPGLKEKLTPLLEKQFGCKVVIGQTVDPSLIGGFKIEVGDYELDVSVRRQIDKIRRQFYVSNNRIV